VDEEADVLVVTSGWPHPADPTSCVFIERQMESLAARGVHFDVLLIRGFESSRAYVDAALLLARWSRSRAYRLVHAHGGEAAVAAWFYRGAPLLVSYLGSDLLGAAASDGHVGRRRRARSAALRQLSRFAAATITKSEAMAATLPPSTRRRNVVLPNGVDMTVFRPLSQQDARERLGWSPDERVALWVAKRRVPGKRLWLAEATVERARQELPELRLEVADGVPHAQMPLLMNAADCLLVTSASEGSPNVVKEALMCNLPIVATAVGDVPQLLDGVVPSQVCDASDAELAAAVIDCVRRRLRSNGRAVSGRLDARVIADRLVALYTTLAPELRIDTRGDGEESPGE
jgi:glycosyltransferase involved in cell wall biosynthesis